MTIQIHPPTIYLEPKPHSIGRRISDSLRQDFGGLVEAFAPSSEPETGLHTYRIEYPDGGKMRIHLRIEPGGPGVLFVDVTDVIHLSPIAARIAKFALDGTPEYRARAALQAQYGRIEKDQFVADIAHVYAMVEDLKDPEVDCRTCALTYSVETHPLFSLGVNAPYKVDLALTYGCNNQCPHCYNETDRLGMPSLPFEDWATVLDKVAQLGIPHVILTGGEATLHPNLPEIIRYADQKGMIVGLNTNGRHIAHAPYMQELADSGLDHIQITLASNRPEVHDAMMGAKSFHQTVRGIENAIESGVHVITNSTLMRYNMNDAEEIIDFLYDKGIRTFAMNGMIYSGGGFAHPAAIPENEMPPLLIRVRDHAENLGMRFLWYTPTEYCRMSPVELEIGAKRCNAGEYSLCIEPNGDVLPCQSYYVSAGNILMDPWETIWNGELFRSFRDREDDPSWAGLPEKCQQCPDLPLCGGGCRIEREAREGVRVSKSGGGGCSGCSGSCGTGAAADAVSAIFPPAGIIHDQHHENHFVPSGGYIPPAGLVDTNVRASGDMPLIRIEDIKN
jgi:radical SAM protein with 4Fe4S-binding SPASM domain